MKTSAIIYFSILVIGALTGIIKWKRLSTTSRVLACLIFYVLVKELSAYIMATTTTFNLSFYKYLSPVDFLLTIAVFMVVPILKPARYILIGFAIIGLSIYFLNIGVWQQYGKGIDSYFKMARSILLVSSALLLFFYMTRHVQYGSVLRISDFWLSCGVLFFYVISVFYWGVFNYGLKGGGAGMKNVLRPLYEYSNYIYYFLLALTIFLNNFIEGKKDK